MTVSSQTSNDTFDGTGVATVFPLPFRFFSNSDVFVYLVKNANTPSQVVTPMIIGTDYTLYGAGLPEQFGTAPGRVTTTVPVAVGNQLFVERVMDIEQLTDIINQGRFFPEVHEDVFDRLTMLIQQNGASFSRAIKVPPYDPAPRDLPSVPGRRDKLMGFNTVGDPIAVAPVSGSASDLAMLLASTATGNGDAMLGVLNPWTGAYATTQHDYNARTVHIDDFIRPDQPANTLVTRAVAGTPTGWKLQLGKGPYLGSHVIYRDDIFIQGVGCPTGNASRSKLVGGTIILGKFHVRGDNLRVEDFGADRGLECCNTYYGGVPDDGFVVAPTQPAISTNVVIRNVAGLCRSESDLYHPMLIQGLDQAVIQNVHGYLGFTGPVFKIQRGVVSGVYGYGNSQSGMQIKSDSYAMCNRVTFDNIVIDAEGKDAANSSGVFLYAASAQLANITIGKSRIRGHRNTMSLNAVAFVINDVHLGDILGETPTDCGLVSDGPVVAISAGHVKITKPASGRSVRISSDCLGFDIHTIEAHAPAGLTLADSIQLGGVFKVGLIDTTTNYVPNTPTGVAITPHVGFPREWLIGMSRATLSVNSGAAGYRSGFGTANGDTVRCWVEANTVRIRGTMTIPAAASRPGAEQCYQVNPSIAPVLAGGEFRKGDAMIYVSSTVANVLTTCHVDAAGAVTLPFLTNTSHVPTAALQVTIDMSWPLK